MHKVGKIYSANDKLEDVLNKEMSRLNRAFEEKLVVQDEKLMAA